MSNDKAILTVNSGVLGIEVPKTGTAHVAQQTQYGVIWPDGTTTWQQIDRGMGTTPIYISDIVPDNGEKQVNAWSAQCWDELLKTRAGQALLDVDDYRDMHRFVKRHLVLTVTAAEEV
jgi:hypothetical protein